MSGEYLLFIDTNINSQLVFLRRIRSFCIKLEENGCIPVSRSSNTVAGGHVACPPVCCHSCPSRPTRCSGGFAGASLRAVSPVPTALRLPCSSPRRWAPSAAAGQVAASRAGCSWPGLGHLQGSFCLDKPLQGLQDEAWASVYAYCELNTEVRFAHIYFK